MSTALTLPYISAMSAEEKATAPHACGPIDGIACYRKQTELLLRRYMLVSLQTGRVPSLLGNSVFRGRASSYRIRCFEDAVIFLFDVEKCLNKIDPYRRELISRITLQEYTQEETAQLMGQSLRSIIRNYAEAIDKLSRIFLNVGLLPMDPKILSRGQKL